MSNASPSQRLVTRHHPLDNGVSSWNEKRKKAGLPAIRFPNLRACHGCLGEIFGGGVWVYSVAEGVKSDAASATPDRHLYHKACAPVVRSKFTPPARSYADIFHTQETPRP